MADVVNNPSHYAQASTTIEPIDVLRHASFDLGNALKYMARAGHKGEALVDWKKAEKYLEWVREAYLVNPEPYDSFLKNHGLYLKKFKVFETVRVESGFYPLLGDLEELVEQNIVCLSARRLSHNGKIITKKGQVD